MTNMADCPNCGAEIDATAAALTGYCPECDTAFSALVRMTAPDGDDPEMSDHYKYND